MLFSLPVWGLIAVAIKWDDGGQIFFLDDRVGREGVVFKALKFRTMLRDADALFGRHQAMDNDPRVTRVGRFLRATALDELPQLWNIFRGDMSFVGPRPLRPGEIEIHGSVPPSLGSRMRQEEVRRGVDRVVVSLEQIPGYRERHAVRPGLTGIAQIFANRDIPRRRKFRYDLLYIRRRCFWLDFWLIALSFWITFRGRWEVRGKKL